MNTFWWVDMKCDFKNIFTVSAHSYVSTYMHPSTSQESVSDFFLGSWSTGPGHWPLSKSLYIFSSWATSSSVAMKLQPLGRVSCIAVCICKHIGICSPTLWHVRITHWQGRSPSTGHSPRSTLAAGPSSCAREGSSCLLSRTDCVSLSSGKHVPSRNYKYKSLVKGKSLKEKRG